MLHLGFLLHLNYSNHFDPVTVSKIHILGYSYKKLLKQIPPQNLPVKFGGMSDVSDDDLLLKDVGPWRSRIHWSRR